ncbi:histidine triad nucleotide-binding protein [bacterium]|nr:histidine triad nucleotide-binding protein [bacterium]
MEKCLFCKVVNKQIPAKIIYEDDIVVAFEDINPQAPVHILLIPKKHVETVLDLTEEDKDLAGYLFLAAGKIARDIEALNDGFRIVVNCKENAGQAVFHLHLHILGGRRMQWPPG